MSDYGLIFIAVPCYAWSYIKLSSTRLDQERHARDAARDVPYGRRRTVKRPRWIGQ